MTGSEPAIRVADGTIRCTVDDSEFETVDLGWQHLVEEHLGPEERERHWRRMLARYFVYGIDGNPPAHAEIGRY